MQKSTSRLTSEPFTCANIRKHSDFECFLVALVEQVWTSAVLKDKNRLLFVVDLDKTLIDSEYVDNLDDRVQHFTEHGALRCTVHAKHAVEKLVRGRPGVRHLLTELSLLGEIVFFTSASTAHSTAVVEFLHDVCGLTTVSV